MSYDTAPYAKRRYLIEAELTRLLPNYHLRPAPTGVVVDDLATALGTTPKAVKSILLAIAKTHPHATHDGEFVMMYGQAMRRWRWHSTPQREISNAAQARFSPKRAAEAEPKQTFAQYLIAEAAALGPEPEDEADPFAIVPQTPAHDAWLARIEAFEKLTARNVLAQREDDAERKAAGLPLRDLAHLDDGFYDDGDTEAVDPFTIEPNTITKL